MIRIEPPRRRRLDVCPALGVALLACSVAVYSGPLCAQQPSTGSGPMGRGPASHSGSGGGASSGNTGGAEGGGANADFDSLIDLIESTVAVDTWAENGGGDAEIMTFPTGVSVDAADALAHRETAADGTLSKVRGTVPPSLVAGGDPRQASTLRYVSLPRLEREIARRQQLHKPLDAVMLTLAGMRRVHYVIVYPESGDLVLAGPAGDWRVDPAGHIVAADTGGPVVRLDDLLLLARRAGASPDSQFGCAITPRQEALARTQAFLNKTAGQAIEPRDRKAWLLELRKTLGKQDISIWGIDPGSRAARVIVAADYHMKLVGMGLADGVDGVPSYLASIPRGGPAPMTVLRWWFTLNYDGIRTSPAGDVYELMGQGVRVMSENEMLAAQGKRVHTGQSDPLNRQFAERFTDHFDELAEKYPIYAELRNVFDLALVSGLIQHDHLVERVGWKPTLLADGERLRLPTGPAPKEVDSVINYRIMRGGRQIVAGVSGGVSVETAGVVSERTVDQTGTLARERAAAPVDLEPTAWWWDAAD